MTLPPSNISPLTITLSSSITALLVAAVTKNSATQTTTMTKNSRRPLPRLDRRNAAKNIDYSPSHLMTRSLDLFPPYSDDQTSFRIPDGEVDLLFRNLGISGPEDFAIPAAAWEAARAHRSASDLLPRSRLSPAAEFLDPPRVSGSGIRGVRPPIIASTEEAETISTISDPPTVSGAAEVEMVGPSWDLIRSFAPQEEEQEQEVRVRLEEENPDDVTSTSNYDDSPGRTREMIFVISPDAKFKRRIKSWMKGQLLGSGSFGTVYEGISDDGIFFAVKEVSLLDQGNNAQQCILQLEQEITLLSQFEHENIVQYHGTDKEEAKLFIFIELVTQGSLASLYRKYCLQDSQVSSYTRQILKGLNYLHERNVVHRDIKCANILVHANGSVKLADFGLAKEMSKINMLKSCKGSVYWMAPEVVNPRKTYGPAADIWSLGCTVLEMLTRQIPHPNLEWQHAFFKIGRGEQPPIPSNLSKDARDFITQCVQVNPDDRPSASQLLNHPFVRSRLPYSLRLGSDYSSSPGRDR